MESVIKAYLEEYYPYSPVFLFGSRANGNSTEESDWDIGVINAKKGLNIGDIHFFPLDTSDLDNKATRYIFVWDITSFAKKIIPLQKEEIVRKVERKAKEHIIQYVMQKTGKSSISGREVIDFYFRKNAEIKPSFRKKAFNFLQSKESVVVSKLYDDVLKDFKPVYAYNYRDYGKMDNFCNFIENPFKGIPRSRPTCSRTLNYTKESLKGFVDIAKDFIHN